MPDSQRCHDLGVLGFVLAVQVIEQTPTLVHQRHQSAPRAKILGMGFEVRGQVGNAFGHSGDLIFRRSGIGGVTLVREAEGGDALGADVGCGEEDISAGGRRVFSFEVGGFEEEVIGIVAVFVL